MDTLTAVMQKTHEIVLDVKDAVITVGGLARTKH